MKRLFRLALIVALLLGVAGLRHAPVAAEQEAPPAETETAEELDEFVPTEKLPADSAISFPVDI